LLISGGTFEMNAAEGPFTFQLLSKQPLHIGFLIKEAVDVYSRRAMSPNNF
jgi:hypothetical protein